MPYKDPIQRRANQRRYRERHHEELKARARARYHARKSEMRSTWRAAEREQYWKDPESRRAKVRKQQAKKYQIIADLKRQPCADCGVSYQPCVMDFDHRPGETKARRGIVGIVSSGSISALMDEISKCDLVCANCHRIRTCKTHHITHQPKLPASDDFHAGT